jgi:hypothetical protein
MDFSNKKVVFFLNAKQDGSGDFAIGNKIVNKLMEMGIQNTNITIIFYFDNEFLENFINFNKEFKKNCTTEQIKTSTHQISESDYEYLNSITLSICEMYKKIYGTDDNALCINPINKEITKIITHPTSDSNLIPNVNFSDTILQILKQNLTDGYCSVDKQIFMDFYDGFVNNAFFSIWMINIIKFFINSNLSSCNYRYSNKNNKFNKEELDIAGVNKNDILLLTFLYSKCCDELTEYKILKLDEGGLAKVNVYAPGLGDMETNLGINIVPEEKLNMALSVIFNNEHNTFSKVMLNNNYNICYFGGITDFPSCINILMLYKLKYFIKKIQLVQRNSYDEYNVFIPYNSYSFIKKYINISRIILTDLIVDNDTLYFDYDKKVNLLYFKGLDNNKFINFVNKSQKLCILSGDQSFFEGLSMGKDILYDLLSHKYDLYLQFLQKMKKFSNDITYLDLDKMIKNTQIHEIGNMVYDYPYMDKQVVIEDISPIIIDLPGIFSTMTTDVTAEKITINGTNDIICNYCDIAKLYDINYNLITKTNETRDPSGNTFVQLLHKNYNFDANLQELLKLKFNEVVDKSTGGYIKSNNNYYNKYLKYKHKYIQLKKLL